MYFVPASIIMFIPSSIGLQNIGDAHVLSITVGIFFLLAILVIFGISRISNVAVPGDSKYINLVFGLINFSNFFISIKG